LGENDETKTHKLRGGGEKNRKPRNRIEDRNRRTERRTGETKEEGCCGYVVHAGAMVFFF
jgi:hypothetical protein